jgi:hypothetical protein
MKHLQVTILVLLCATTILFSQKILTDMTTGITALTTAPGTPILLTPTNAATKITMGKTTVDKPGVPNLIVPTNNQTLTMKTVTLTWGTVAGAETYHIYVGMVGTPTGTKIVDSTLSVGSLSLTGLGNGTYGWYVYATNAGGSSGISNSFRFDVWVTDIKSANTHYLPAGIGHDGILSVYMANGSRVMELAYGPMTTKAQLLNTAYKTLAKGCYTYRFHSADVQREIVGKLIK